MPTPARWRFLAETSDLLDRSLDYEETLTNVVQSVLPRIADCAIIALTCPSEATRREFSAHRDPARSALLDDIASAWANLSVTRPAVARLLRANETRVVDIADDGMLDTAVGDHALCAMLRELAVRSMIFIPLTARDQRFGCLALATTGDSNRRYGAHDVAIANAVARRAALAIDHALLYRASAHAARARDEMVAIVSHDLKNPLATIQLAVNFMLEELAPRDDTDQAGRAQLNVIRRSAERMYRLVHDLLDVSAAESGRLPIVCTRLGVDVLVADAFELLRPLAAAKGIALAHSLDPSLPPVAADRERMLQVFSNIGGNALTFTPEGGRVEIRALSRGALVELSVVDTGRGIAADELPHVFDRFWQGAAKKTRSGVGLGLAIARGIVEAHGGEIRVESAPGQGTSFTFTLPAMAA